MEGQLRHLLNGSVITDEPGGWREFTEELDRNLDERIIHLKYSNSLLFIGDGYFTLRQLFEDNYCTEVTYECQQFVQGSWQSVADGLIILSDIVWNLSKCTADTTITDATVGAVLLNNKNVPALPGGTSTKNGNALTPVPVINLEVFDPSDAEATYLTGMRNAYDWKLCMRHLLAYISDGTVAFESAWYDSLPDNERFAVISGAVLRTGNNDLRPPEYTLETLWQFGWRSDNLMAGIVEESGAITFRVEPASYWYGAPGPIVLLHQEDLEQSIDTDLLYSAITLGSEAAIKNEADEADWSLPYVGLRTFAEERYGLRGQCNTDNTLNLKLPFVVCTNAIEDAVVNQDDGNDEEVFVIQYDRTTSKAYKSDYLTSNGVPWLYNERFLNRAVVGRWNLPAAGVTYYADQDAAFRAERTVSVSTYSQTGFSGVSSIGQTQIDARFRFDNDYTAPNFDADNNWGNGTTQGNPVSDGDSRYTAPIAGLYSFEVGMIINAIRIDQYIPEFIGGGVLETGRRLRILPSIKWRHYNASNTLLNEYVVGPPAPGQLFSLLDPNTFIAPIDSVGTYSVIRTRNVDMNLGDYLEVWFKGQTWIQTTATGPNSLAGQLGGLSGNASLPLTVEYAFLQGSYVRTVFVATAGGEIIGADPDAYYATKLEYTRHIDNEGWNVIKGNFAAAVQVAHDGSTLRQGYPRIVARKVHSGETEWELIGNRNQVNR